MLNAFPQDGTGVDPHVSSEGTLGNNRHLSAGYLKLGNLASLLHRDPYLVMERFDPLHIVDSDENNVEGFVFYTCNSSSSWERKSSSRKESK